MVGFKKRFHIAPGPAAPGDPPIIRQFIRPIKRSRLASWWDGRGAVRAGVSLQDYLQYRLRYYQSRAPQHRYPLPFYILIEDGEMIRVPNPNADRHPWESILEDPAGEDSFEAAAIRVLRFLSRSESQAILRDLQQHEKEFASLASRFMDVSQEIEDLKVAGEREIAEGQALPPATLARSRRQRGRPRLPFPWLLVGGHLATSLAVFLEAYQFALPYLNSIGVDVSNLAMEWQRNKISILAGGGFALTAAAGIFLLWHWVFQATASLYHDPDEASETGWKRSMRTAWPGILGALLIATSWGIGAMRYGISEGSRIFQEAIYSPAADEQGSGWIFVLLTILVPLAVAYLQDRMGEILEKRRQVRKEQEAWGLKENESISVGERREELIRRREEEREKLERRREAARQEIQKIGERAQATERQIREILELERRHGLAYANSLAAALEQDRYYFLKAAREKDFFDQPTQGQPASPAMRRKGPLRKFVGSLRSHHNNHRPPVS